MIIETLYKYIRKHKLFGAPGWTYFELSIQKLEEILQLLGEPESSFPSDHEAYASNLKRLVIRQYCPLLGYRFARAQFLGLYPLALATLAATIDVLDA
jgi:hypothetical protein